MAVKPIPDGCRSVTPYLILDDAARALEFYKKALRRCRADAHAGTRRQDRARRDPHRRFAGHARRRKPEMNARSARTHRRLADLADDLRRERRRDRRTGRRRRRHARPARRDQFYGDRTGGIDDPFGFHWYLATHVEDVQPDELERRAAKAMGG